MFSGQFIDRKKMPLFTRKNSQGKQGSCSVLVLGMAYLKTILYHQKKVCDIDYSFPGFMSRGFNKFYAQAKLFLFPVKE
jgi:hypothetical protein